MRPERRSEGLSPGFGVTRDRGPRRDLGRLEDAGYARSRAGVPPAPIADAIAAAPPKRPARPHPRSRWRDIEVDIEARTVTRPQGIRIDTGGVGKGLAADLASARHA